MPRALPTFLSSGSGWSNTGHRRKQFLQAPFTFPGEGRLAGGAERAALAWIRDALASGKGLLFAYPDVARFWRQA